MTPSVRVAQAPRRHRADNRKVFMVAAPRREESLVLDARGKQWDF